MNCLPHGLSVLRQGIMRGLLGPAVLLVLPAQAANVTEYSLEELLTMEVTSAARKNQRLSEAAAAIHVITQEDIRHSGMTSIPELLRTVPGLQVAQIDASKWAISARGFNSRLSNKLLILMDGRTLYSSLFSGVYWDVQDTLLEDIERIEVILGPGGTLWGANAVNGVINIITRHSGDTQGGLVTALAGDQENGASLRYGGAVGEDSWFRTYAKANKRDNFVDANADASHDAWDIQRLGFRTDWEYSSQDALTLQGDLYQGDAEQTIINLENLFSTTQFQQDSAALSGGNLLMRWNHAPEQGADWELLAYFDQATRDDLSGLQRIKTFDVDFHQRFRLLEHQEITWGMGYRRIEDDTDGSFTVSFNPENTEQDIYSVFIQDEIFLRNDLRLTLGSKFEHNDFTGFEYQPSVRLLWLMAKAHSLWGAVSRAVRVPSRSDVDIRVNAATSPVPVDPTLISVLGNKNFESEEILAFELGYRGQPRSDISLDVAVFYNIYDKLATSEVSFSMEGTPIPTNGLIASTYGNQMTGDGYGMELATDWQAMSNWRLSASYSWLKQNLRLDTSATNIVKVRGREDSTPPEQQFQLRSSWNIRDQFELDMALYYVDDIVALDPAGNVSGIPAYTRLDIRLGWQPQENIELSLVAQNLLDDNHAEFFTPAVLSSDVPRSFYAQAKLWF